MMIGRFISNFGAISGPFQSFPEFDRFLLVTRGNRDGSCHGENSLLRLSDRMKRSIMDHIPPDLLDDLIVSEQTQVLDYFTEDSFTLDHVDSFMQQVIYF